MRKAFAEVKAAYLDRGRPIGPRSSPPRWTVSPKRSAPWARRSSRCARSFPSNTATKTLIDLTAYPPPGSTDVEVFYNRLDPFFWSWVVSLAATLCLLLAVGRWQKPLFWLGVAVLVAAQGFTAAGWGCAATSPAWFR